VCKAAVERVAWAFAFDGDYESVVAIQVAEHGVGVLSVDFHEPLKGNRVSFSAGRRGVAQNANKEIIEKVWENFALAETIYAAGRDFAGPMIELRGVDGGHLEARKVRPQHVWAKERFDFNWHDWP
jgi:hypothetical protein